MYVLRAHPPHDGSPLTHPLALPAAGAPAKAAPGYAGSSAAELLRHCLVDFEGKETYDIYPLRKDKAETVWIRPCYHDILRIIGSEPLVKRWTINGNPGIGKSVFSHLIMSVLLRAGKRVIYRVQDLDPISLREGEEPYTVPLSRLEVELFQPSTVYVVDGRDPGLLHTDEVLTFLVCSPRKAHWHDFMKGRDRVMLYMPVWTLEELEQCRAWLYPKVSADLLADLFGTAGGIPRFVLKEASALLARGEAPDSVASQLRDFVLNRLGQCSSLDSLLSHVGDLNAPDDVSHVLLHIKPTFPLGQDDARADDSKIGPLSPLPPAP